MLFAMLALILATILATLLHSKASADSTLTPPVLPLIVRNPYLSVWLGNARDDPWSKWPIFYTGEEVSKPKCNLLCSSLRMVRLKHKAGYYTNIILIGRALRLSICSGESQCISASWKTSRLIGQSCR